MDTNQAGRNYITSKSLQRPRVAAQAKKWKGHTGQTKKVEQIIKVEKVKNKKVKESRQS